MRSEGQQRHPGADAAADRRRDPSRIPRRRRGHHRDEHVHGEPFLAGRLRAEELGARNQPGRGADRAPGRGRVHRADRQGDVRGRRARPDESHGVAVAERQRSGLSQHRFRPACGDLPRRCTRADRRRRRSAADRDDLRHAERQGCDLRGATGRRRVGHRHADHHLRHDHRCFRPHAVGPDDRGVLEFDAPCAAARHRSELRARREAAASVHRRAVAHRRCLRQRLSERRPAECLRRVRRSGVRDGGADPRVRDQRLRQHRRRLLRHDARSHPPHRRSGRGLAAAQAAADRAAAAPVGPGAAEHRRQTACSSTSASGPTSRARRSFAG